jgi:hypothetical protein
MATKTNAPAVDQTEAAALQQEIATLYENLAEEPLKLDFRQRYVRKSVPLFNDNEWLLRDDVCGTIPDVEAPYSSYYQVNHILSNTRYIHDVGQPYRVIPISSLAQKLRDLAQALDVLPPTIYIVGDEEEGMWGAMDLQPTSISFLRRAAKKLRAVVAQRDKERAEKEAAAAARDREQNARQELSANMERFKVLVDLAGGVNSAIVLLAQALEAQKGDGTK